MTRRLRLRRLTLVASTLTAIAAICAAVNEVPLPEDWSSSTVTEQPTPTPPTWRGHTPTRHQVLARLARVEVVPTRPDVAGYDRECGTGHTCSFGPDWTDDNNDPAMGHNGCGTRDDVLARDLRRVTFRPGSTHDCVVESGILRDPYTGQRIEFEKAQAYLVGVDHMYPLARAWDMGASTWSLDSRIDFANDSRNLLAVSGSANSSKSDQGPGEWLPLNRGFACTYLEKYLTVAEAYDLPITRTDADSIKATANAACRQR